MHVSYLPIIYLVSLEPPLIRQVAKLIQKYMCMVYQHIVDVFMHAPQLLLAITIVFQSLSKNYIHPP